MPRWFQTNSFLYFHNDQLIIAIRSSSLPLIRSNTKLNHSENVRTPNSISEMLTLSQQTFVKEQVKRECTTISSSVVHIAQNGLTLTCLNLSWSLVRRQPGEALQRKCLTLGGTFKFYSRFQKPGLALAWIALCSWSSKYPLFTVYCPFFLFPNTIYLRMFVSLEWKVVMNQVYTRWLCPVSWEKRPLDLREHS